MVGPGKVISFVVQVRPLGLHSSILRNLDNDGWGEHAASGSITAAKTHLRRLRSNARARGWGGDVEYRIVKRTTTVVDDVVLP